MSTIDSAKYLVVGAGFFGAVIAERIANVLNEKVTVVERRNHIGGNCYSAIHPSTGIEYHAYGTHIFHTSNTEVWSYLRQFTVFNGYHHQVLTTHRNKVYQMPINLETINAFYGINLRPFEAESFLAEERKKSFTGTAINFEEKALSLVGRPLYEAFIRGYTVKQWGKDPKTLPADILTRLPFRTDYNESYFHDRWQGVPEDGYTAVFSKMLKHKNIDLHLNIDFFDIKDTVPKGTSIIYSGPIDRFFDYKFGRLEWRTLDFEHQVMGVSDFQGTSVMNYAEECIPFTRVHEPKHLHPEREYPDENTLIIKEFSKMDDGAEPYYPINDTKNQALLKKYLLEANKHPAVFINGRLGQYKYIDMHQTIENALDLFEIIQKTKVKPASNEV